MRRIICDKCGKINEKNQISCEVCGQKFFESVKESSKFTQDDLCKHTNYEKDEIFKNPNPFSQKFIGNNTLANLSLVFCLIGLAFTICFFIIEIRYLIFTGIFTILSLLIIKKAENIYSNFTTNLVKLVDFIIISVSIIMLLSLIIIELLLNVIF